MHFLFVNYFIFDFMIQQLNVSFFIMIKLFFGGELQGGGTTKKECIFSSINNLKKFYYGIY